MIYYSKFLLLLFTFVYHSSFYHKKARTFLSRLTSVREVTRTPDLPLRSGFVTQKSKERRAFPCPDGRFRAPIFIVTHFVTQIQIEQNRCAMACQGRGAVLLYRQIKSSGSTFRNSVLLSYHTKQLNTESSTAYENNSIYRRLPQSEL